jgi:hypothetical protein
MEPYRALKQGRYTIILTTFISGKYFSPSFGGLIVPSTVSAVLNPNSLIWD